MIDLKENVRLKTEGKLPAKGFWRTVGDMLFSKKRNQIESIIDKNFVPHPEPTGNPILNTFIWGGDQLNNDVHETYPDVRWTLVCHKHRFMGQFYPKYYGTSIINLVNCPFCDNNSGFEVTLSQKDMDHYMGHQTNRPDYIASSNHFYQGMSDSERTNVTGQGREGKYLFMNTTHKRTRNYYASYTHRWKYVNGIAIPVDGSSKDKDVYNGITN